MRKPRPPLSKELQLCVFRRNRWICQLCDRPVIFAPVMRLVENCVRATGKTEPPLSYYHAHWTRAGAPLLDELGAVIDHIEAFSAGGASTEDNLATLCNKCNTQKSAGTAERHRARHPHTPVKGKYGPPLHWDGLSALFVVLARRHESELSASERSWLKVLTAETLADEGTQI